jgi:DNA-directed RNA polymerase specialized sigma24 family protein
MTQYERVRKRLASQSQKVMSSIMSRFKKKESSREVSNVEIEYVGYQYSLKSGITDEYGFDAQEWWHDRLTRLTPQQMDIYQMKFIDGLSPDEMAKRLSISKRTFYRHLQAMYDVLRPEHPKP